MYEVWKFIVDGVVWDVKGKSEKHQDSRVDSSVYYGHESQNVFIHNV